MRFDGQSQNKFWRCVCSIYCGVYTCRVIDHKINMSYHAELNAWEKKESGADEVKHITTIKMAADAEGAVEIVEDETAKIKEAARVEGKERKHFPGTTTTNDYH
ncbi:hypothetical protein AVEN_66048-1 [Araneus ventricosus]|uniref:Uncharacterized protein n=1 Tax=Araneus ventricosus TaxID=182803 RepID=A0A4Y2JXK8_ARAVE|nr:hypothetical protein AVEN_66048-1 [Araneus ventricosus]